MELVLDKYLSVNEGKENTRATRPVPGRVASPVFEIEDDPSLQKMVHEAHSGSQEPSSGLGGAQLDIQQDSGPAAPQPLTERETELMSSKG